MLHGILIEQGKATPTYVNKWVKTARLLHDRARGFGYGEQGEAAAGNAGIMLESMDSNGIMKGRANTAVVYHGGKLLALHEGDMPYSISAPFFETLGKYSFGGKLKHRFTAHPKLDKKTGEMAFFGANFQPAPPWVHYGKLVRSFP